MKLVFFQFLSQLYEDSQIEKVDGSHDEPPRLSPSTTPLSRKTPPRLISASSTVSLSDEVGRLNVKC